ncbi:MAG TPA: anthranilate phosphoribosyltransferase [Bacteroidota bacterium]|nr:anthranilate phosphoribosyltransferase [Bacteroidota bacterium]
MKEVIRKISEGEHLTREEAAGAMREIMEGSIPDAQIAGFLMGMRMKGEQPEELAGFVETMREKAVRIRVDDPDAIDLCGTGGDGTNTVNISTTVAFVVAGAGVTVAKHGNRSVSSASGSADLLQALGATLDVDPAVTERSINSIGVGFMFAPLYHPAMKHAAAARNQLGIKTCFNMLGPLTNPAGVTRQIVGAFSRDAAATIAGVFSLLPHTHVVISSSQDGMDEISLGASTDVFEKVSGRPLRSFVLSPGDFPLPQVEVASLAGSSPAGNARKTMDVLSGEPGPFRDVVLANAAYALIVAGKASCLEEGVACAGESIDSGRALATLNRFIGMTRQ